MIKVLLVGSGAREASLAWKLSSECAVFCISPHENPTILRAAKISGGKVIIGNPSNPEFVAKTALEYNIDLAFVSSDSPLEAGVIDALKKTNMLCVGPTKAAAEIEWSKSFGRRLVDNVMPEFAPKFWIIENEESCKKLFSELEITKMPIVVKPVGLTGGKGVRVMGEHLKNYAEALSYALALLQARTTSGQSVIIEEKVEGTEFTFQVLSDGRNVVPLPATFDYPYRYDGDTGPGTGGMGSYSNTSTLLPFLTQANYDTCLLVAQKAIAELAARGRPFVGVLYTGFFVNHHGVKIVEFNARFGDPECTNIMTTLEVPLLPILESMTRGELAPSLLKFKSQATVTKYLVTPEYAVREGKEHRFTIDVEKIEREGGRVFFSAAKPGPTPQEFLTTGNSRTVAITMLDSSVRGAASRVNEVIEKYHKGPLEFRRDIGMVAGE
jgi:phosphoribosylamine--glycine ligase